MSEVSFYHQLLNGLSVVRARQRDDAFALDNILSGQSYYRKSFLDNTLSDLSFYLTVLGSGVSGFAYYNGEPMQGEAIRQIIDRDAIEVLRNEEVMDFPLRVSIMDAVYGQLNRLFGRGPYQTFAQSGTYREKANFRSRLLIEQMVPGQRVLLVGLVTEFVRDMLGRGLEVSISDLSPELVDANVYGVPVVNRGNDWTLRRLAASDAAIITGSAFSSNTVDSILEAAKSGGVDLYFYLETGSNFAPYLIERGAKFVLAEKFPFYDLPGETVFEVYKNDPSSQAK